ncbi:MAG: PHP domain-containing protein [Actinomycetota bacterium]|nr:PHP domain-containing protein [Actinomycetota bacterium]
MSVPNMDVAELLALRAAELDGDRQRAYRRAANAALRWPEEVADIVAAGRSLTELKGIGVKLSGLIGSWLEEPPEVPERPPIRSGFMSFAEALNDARGADAFRVKGDLQMHSVASDGRASIEDMARAGIELGYGFIGITDHSKGLPIAGGIDEEVLAEQAREIETLNDNLATEDHDFKVLKSMEMNLDPAGTGDMEPDALAQLDIVLGSFHSSLRKKEDQTDRYIAALRNPDIQVLGHPRGRIYNFRAGLEADWPKVFAVAAEEGKALECDCFPYRQDLNVELLMVARDAGTWISLGTDAHNEAEMEFMPIGIASALRAGIPRDKILNLMTPEEIVGWAHDPDLRRA